MDHAGRRIPAWKRLGLKLKSSQSGTENQENEHQVAEHRHGESQVAKEPISNIDHHAPGRVEESNPSLGKRKHTAEDDGHTVKKSKKTQDHDEAYGNTGQTPATIPRLDNGAAAPLSSTAASDKLQPKGDPNYRRKKGRKIEEYKTRKPVAAPPTEVSSAHTLHERPRTPSLSPGQLDVAFDGATLLASTETDFPESTSIAKHEGTKRLAKEDRTNSASSSLSPRIDRRKSVTFTPDTKTVDGNSASTLFKKWAQEQKGAGAEFSESEVAQFAPPPKSHPANDLPTPAVTSAKADKKAAKAEKKAKKLIAAPQPGTSEVTETLPAEAHQDLPPKNKQASTPAVSTGKTKDISRYTDYLTQYHSDRPNWKFNKAKQNDILENALNIFRIPDTYSEALIAYIKGLQGAGVIERLKQRCATAIEELNAELSTMDDAEVRKAAEEEALQERLTQERKRRRLEGDIENMLDHPHSEGYIRRLKRGRAQALLNALSLAAPAPAPVKPQVRMNGLSKKFSPEPERPLVPISQARKRKRRTDVSSDESSDSSSSDSSSDSSEDSDEADSDSGSASSASSEAGDSVRDASNSDEAPGSALDSSASSDSGSASESGSKEAGSDSDSDSS